jgi:ribosomal protein S12 methylthiotransferase
MSAKPATSVALVSLGCPKNLVDSERMLAILAEHGCVVGAEPETADVIVINTCGFLQAARDESFDHIRQALARKAAGTCRRVVVAGCLATRDRRRLLKDLPGIDAVVGVNDRRRLAEAVLAEGLVVRLAGPPPRAVGDSGRFRLTPRHVAYLRISEGCSHKCTFCTIPGIRGPYRSKTPRAVLAEARELASDGALELNLIGQDTTAYGSDLGGPALPRLLEDLSRVDGVRWLRLMYAYPQPFGDDLIDAIGRLEKVCKYVDLPLQHISDPVLRRMGRRVTRRQTEDLLDRLRTRVPGLAVRTTFIVGFPGETDRQFDELLTFVRQAKFDAVGVFAYSAEEGTPARRLPGHLPQAVKDARARELMLAQRRIAHAAARAAVGRRLDVLVDGDLQGRRVGRHRGQAPEVDSVCVFSGKRPTPGTIVPARVTGAKGYDLTVSACGRD